MLFESIKKDRDARAGLLGVILMTAVAIGYLSSFKPADSQAIRSDDCHACHHDMKHAEHEPEVDQL
jgi:hypothetical protein